MPGDDRWMERCAAHKERIIRGILRDMDKSGRDVSVKYSFGRGNTGIKRELYCAAWYGFETLPDLARLPEGRMAETMRAALTPASRR